MKEPNWKLRGASLLLAGALTLSLSACTSGKQPETPPAPQPPEQTAPKAPDGADLVLSQRQQDLALFASTLETNHKNLFFQLSKQDFDQELARTKGKLSTLSDQELFYEYRRLAALVGDAHTSVWYQGDQYDFLTALPFAISQFEDGWRLTILDGDNQQYLGWKLTAINGCGLDEVYQRARSIISYDNQGWLDSQFSNTINFADALLYLGVIDDVDDVKLTAVGPQGESATFPLTSYHSSEEILSAQIVRVTPPAYPTAIQNEIYWYALLESGPLYIQYNSCKEDPLLPISTFRDQISQSLGEGNVPAVIVDLRYNSGGNSAVLGPIIDLLGQYRENGGRLYALIGPSTFSSGLLNAIELQEAGAKLVGRPTGGSVNSYGEVQRFSLAGLNVMVGYSVKYFEMKPGEPLGRPLSPDLTVPFTYDNYVSGTDETVLAVLADLNTPKE